MRRRGASGPSATRAISARLAKLVGHDDERVAAAATNAVCELAARHVDAARALLRDARSGHDPLVLGCILLGAIASTQPLRDDDVRLLQRALSHDQPQVRRAAIDALALGGGDAAADAVVFALADEEHDVQLAAARALGRLGRAEPLVGVVRDTRDPSSRRRRSERSATPIPTAPSPRRARSSPTPTRRWPAPPSRRSGSSGRDARLGASPSTWRSPAKTPCSLRSTTPTRRS